VNQVALALGFGLVTAAILALGAVGFTLQFGVSNIFNLAFGNVMTVAAFVAYVVNVRAGASVWWALGAGAVAAALLSLAISRFIYTPFLQRGAELFTMVMVSLAVSIILQNVIQGLSGTTFYAYTPVHEPSLRFAGAVLTPQQLAIVGLAALSMLAFHGLLRYTRLGKAMRATAADPELARGCGIATDRVMDIAWLVSGLLCGMAGVVLVMDTAAFDFNTGNEFLLLIVAAAVFGSVGQPYGAMVGALVIGVGSELAGIVSPALKDVVALAILVLTLIVRPSGLRASALARLVRSAR
jgi:branched-subunit amino acid ABC-type transport system permease component